MSTPVSTRIEKQDFPTSIRNVRLNVWTDRQSYCAHLFYQKGSGTPISMAYAVSHSPDRCRLEKLLGNWVLWIGRAAFEVRDDDYQQIAGLLRCKVVSEVAA